MNIIITGDFCPHKRIKQAFLKKEYKDVFNGFEIIANDCDLAITNLECPLTLSNNPIKKTGPNLKTHPACINGIKYGGFNVVTLANNHIMDYGEQGLIDTINGMQKNNINFVGAGYNLKDAEKPLYLDIQNIKIAIVNFCENEWSIAEKNKAGANPLNPIRNYYQIKRAKKNSDFVLVIVHGGHEQYEYPSPRMVETYRFFVDCGANAIISHHTHCPSGYEVYNEVPIFYSLGNFIFDWENCDNSWYEGYCVKLNIDKNTVDGFSLIPYNQCKTKIGLKLLEDTEKEQFLNSIKENSKVIIDLESLDKKWKEFCELRKISYLSSIFSLGKFKRQFLKKKKLSRLVLKRKQLMPLLNLIRCEAHHDILLKILKKEE